MKKLTREQLLQRDTALGDVMVAMTNHDQDCMYFFSDKDECDCNGEINGADLVEHIGRVRAAYAKIINGTE